MELNSQSSFQNYRLNTLVLIFLLLWEEDGKMLALSKFLIAGVGHGFLAPNKILLLLNQQ